MGSLCSIRTNADVLTLQLQTGTILTYAEEGMPVVAKPLMDSQMRLKKPVIITT